MNAQFACGRSKRLHVMANGNRFIGGLVVGAFDIINKTDEVGEKD